ncbi:ERCC4 domain-containing protein [Tunicatimonas pelagia]|uniref:ERCC4 domain-containing protein n=1 Tax=Tunicatimonas pelagia TaxID=931531 RepID=UPI00266510A3|nr:ERCC4 domain-containing protein [Tunicatimonas pelagia]WKN45693.1 ERCC4 domain-containing protein [Tunicatimonas pelagia]
MNIVSELSLINIKVDDRERRSGLLPILQETEGVDLEVQRLPIGDYEVNGQLLVERKTLIDLVASLKSGRLFAQLYRLVQSERPCALLLEGTSTDLHRSGMRREAVQGALMQATLFMQIPVLRAMDAAESASLLLMAARQLNALGTRRSKSPRRWPPRRYPTSQIGRKEKQQLYFLQGLPGIGLTRARLLLEKFGTVQNVLSASERELQEVVGVGRSTAEKIRWVVEEDRVRYNTENE